MSGFPIAPPLLFAQARIEAMSSMAPTIESVSDSSTAWPIGLAFATIAIAAIACVIVQFTQRQRNDTRHLFKELCQAHQLSRGQTRALAKLSKRLQIANPCRLFVEAELWGLAPADSTPQDLKLGSKNSRATGGVREELEQLRQRLFVAGQAESC